MSHHTQPPELTPADEAAVRDLYQRMIDGWNAGSGVGFASVFAEDADSAGAVAVRAV